MSDTNTTEQPIPGVDTQATGQKLEEIVGQKLADTHMAPPATTYPLIHAAIAAVMAEVGHVGKNRKNAQQGYNFRGIADVYQACQLVMAKHGVHVVPHRVLTDEVCERDTRSGGRTFHVRQRIQYRAYATDGSFVTVETTGEAMDTGDKASNKCMSAGMKYALIQLFALPEEDPSVDTETQSHEIVAPKPAEQPKPPEPTPAQIEELSTLIQQLSPWKAGYPDSEKPAAMRRWCDRALGQKEGTLKSVRNLTPEQADKCIGIAKTTIKARSEAAENIK